MSLAQVPPAPKARRAPRAWRLVNAGRILGNALTRFESRVLELLALAGHAGTRLSHVNLTRHLDIGGTRITELARRANMTNAAMTELIDQCEALGLVQRQADPTVRRARVVCFTPEGQAWLTAFGHAVRKAEEELITEIGPDAAALLFGALASYGGVVHSLAAPSS